MTAHRSAHNGLPETDPRRRRLGETVPAWLKRRAQLVTDPRYFTPVYGVDTDGTQNVIYMLTDLEGT